MLKLVSKELLGELVTSADERFNTAFIVFCSRSQGCSIVFVTVNMQIGGFYTLREVKSHSE